MKSGRRKDWESLLNPIDEKNHPIYDDKQIIQEWIDEWNELDKDSTSEELMVNFNTYKIEIF